jgi:hypothetical protein
MTTKTKLIKTVYLYIVAAVSLLFVAIGTGTLLNTALKYYIFPDAEKKSYFECSNPPPTSAIPSKEGATEEQKVQLDALIKDYQNWKENSTGEKCIKPARQNKIIDALTMMIIALPILLIHWRLIRKEKEEKEEQNG